MLLTAAVARWSAISPSAQGMAESTSALLWGIVAAAVAVGSFGRGRAKLVELRALGTSPSVTMETPASAPVSSNSSSVSALLAPCSIRCSSAPSKGLPSYS